MPGESTKDYFERAQKIYKERMLERQQTLSADFREAKRQEYIYDEGQKLNEMYNDLYAKYERKQAAQFQEIEDRLFLEQKRFFEEMEKFTVDADQWRRDVNTYMQAMDDGGSDRILSYLNGVGVDTNNVFEPIELYNSLRYQLMTIMDDNLMLLTLPEREAYLTTRS